MEYPKCGDSAAYISAQDIFLTGGNPYDKTEISRSYQKIGCPSPLNIWNPPSIFIWLAPIVSSSVSISLFLLSIIQILAGIFIAWCGWRLSKGGLSEMIVVLPFAVLTCAAWWYERNVGQISTLLSSVFVLGLYLFIRQSYLIAGILLSIAAIKPHIFFLPMVGVLVLAFRKGQRLTLVGLFLGVGSAILIAEICSPGIIYAWLHREAWPSEVLGSSLVALLRQQTICWLNQDPRWIGIAIPIVALVWTIQRGSKIPHADSVPFLLGLVVYNPFAAPYGFAFDYSILILPVAYMLGRTWTANNSSSLAWPILIGTAVPSLLSIAMLKTNAGLALGQCFASDIWWYLPGFGVLISWWIFGYIENWPKNDEPPLGCAKS